MYSNLETCRGVNTNVIYIFLLVINVLMLRGIYKL